MHYFHCEYWSGTGVSRGHVTQAQVTWYDLSPRAPVTNLFLVIVGHPFPSRERLVICSARHCRGTGKSLLIVSPFPIWSVRKQA